MKNRIHRKNNFMNRRAVKLDPLLFNVLDSLPRCLCSRMMTSAAIWSAGMTRSWTWGLTYWHSSSSINRRLEAR